jgi:hypothetical protein
MGFWVIRLPTEISELLIRFRLQPFRLPNRIPLVEAASECVYLRQVMTSSHARSINRFTDIDLKRKVTESLNTLTGSQNGRSVTYSSETNRPLSVKAGDSPTASDRRERAGQEPTNGRLAGFWCSFYQRAEGERSKRCVHRFLRLIRLRDSEIHTGTRVRWHPNRCNQ